MMASVQKKPDYFKRRDGVWQSPLEFRRASKASSNRKDTAIKYHAAMVKWTEDFVCRECNEYTGGTKCWCMAGN